ncbi:L-seryl-tRNA(Sec) kinase [Anopheles nili]|uniref:L-seryl-tRNA(Sec) kinase n=1 Tax=Anopheles nili TaxID=185578 RepID=UPI00237BE4C0|nr:L-seryl-tRNA(Sec) kinase [Anopheles nili]
MVRICLNVLVGIPASGKTTYCQQVVALPDRKFRVVHVCYDSFIQIDVSYDKFRDEAGLYKTRRRTLLSHIEAIVIALQENDSCKIEELLSDWKREFQQPLNIPRELESSDTVFLIDDNNYYRSMRIEWLKMARKYALGFFETYFSIPLSLAEHRNRHRGSLINQDVINRMYTRLEKPCGKLYRWEQNFISIVNTVDLDIIVEKIHHCFDNPQHAVAAELKLGPMAQSKVHLLDNMLRKAVSSKVAESKDCGMSREELQCYATMLQKRKKSILEQIRSNGQDVPDELLPKLVKELL